MAALAAAKWCDFLENGLTARWTARQPAAQRCTAPPAAAETPEDRQTCPASSVSCHSRAVFAHGRVPPCARGCERPLEPQPRRGPEGSAHNGRGRHSTHHPSPPPSGFCLSSPLSRPVPPQPHSSVGACEASSTTESGGVGMPCACMRGASAHAACDARLPLISVPTLPARARATVPGRTPPTPWTRRAMLDSRTRFRHHGPGSVGGVYRCGPPGGWQRVRVAVRHAGGLPRCQGDRLLSAGC